MSSISLKVDKGLTKVRSLRGLWLAAVILVEMVGTLRATSYYVATTGSDSNAGTSAAPFRHVSKGVAAAANPGDSVIVMDGTYDNEGKVNPSYVVTLTHSGVSGSPITIQAQHRGMAILDAGNTSPGEDTACNGAYAYFNLANASFILIQGFVIQRGCDEGIHSNDSAHDITIKWNEIRNIGNHAGTTIACGSSCGRDGIFMNSSQYNFTFDGNSFHDIYRTSWPSSNFPRHDHGIYTEANNVTIVNNLFYNNTTGWGIQLAGGNNILVENNTFYRTSPQDGAPGQIAWWLSLSDVAIRNNIFYDPPGSAMYPYQAPITSSVFDHNLIYGIATSNVMDGGTPSGLTVTGTVGGNPMVVSTSTPDFHLQAGSAAIGAGSSTAAPSVDFAGVVRPQNGSYDIGAYEFVGTSGSNACDLNQDGAVDSADYYLVAAMAIGSSPCTADIVGVGVCNAAVVQRVANASLGGACLTQ